MAANSPDPTAAPERCWCCGEPAPIRGEGDPWEGRLDGYCESCATTRCDTTDSTCAVKDPAGAGPSGRANSASDLNPREGHAAAPVCDCGGNHSAIVGDDSPGAGHAVTCPVRAAAPGRLDEMLAELEHQFVCARRHEQAMRDALAESADWSQAEDRAWITEAVAESERMSADALERLKHGRAIVERVRRGE